MYIRVQDPDTRHEFDLAEDHPLIRDGLVKPVKSDRYPPSEVARPPKHHIPKAPALKPVQAAPEAPDATEEKR